MKIKSIKNIIKNGVNSAIHKGTEYVETINSKIDLEDLRVNTFDILESINELNLMDKDEVSSIYKKIEKSTSKEELDLLLKKLNQIKGLCISIEVLTSELSKIDI